jgi:hypothetical protein
MRVSPNTTDEVAVWAKIESDALAIIPSPRRIAKHFTGISPGKGCSAGCLGLFIRSSTQQRMFGWDFAEDIERL